MGGCGFLLSVKFATSLLASLAGDDKFIITYSKVLFLPSELTPNTLMK